MIHGRAVLVAFSLIVGGCQGHVNIRPAPPPTAPFAARVHYYNQHRSLSSAIIPTGMGTQVLANGTVISYPTDLLPAVDNDSNAARAMRAEADSHNVVAIITGIALGVFVASGLAMGGYAAASQGRGSAAAYITLASTGGAGLLTAVTTARLSGYFFTALHQQSQLTYEPGLRDRLALCPSRNAQGPLRDCNDPAPRAGVPTLLSPIPVAIGETIITPPPPLLPPPPPPP